MTEKKQALKDVLNIRVDEALSREIDRIAKVEGLSASEAARKLLGHGVEVQRQVEASYLKLPYTLDRENGRVDKKTYDSTGAAVPWAFTDTYTATYALYDTATYTTSSTYTDQAQTYGEFDTAPAPFDPESGRVNATALTGLIVTATQFADVLTSDGYNGSAKGWSIARGGDLVGIDVALQFTRSDCGN